MKEKKYILTKETKELFGVTLYRIEAARDFSGVKKGDKGGWIEGEKNLSHEGDAVVSGNAWVSGDAVVSGDARVYGNAWVSGNALVCGDAKVCGNALVCGDAKVSDYAKVYGNALVCGDAKIESDKDYIVFKNWWSSGRYFTWMRSNNMWKVGCFYGTGGELIKKAYANSPESGREYERVVRYVESILKDEDLKSKKESADL